MNHAKSKKGAVLSAAPRANTSADRCRGYIDGAVLSAALRAEKRCISTEETGQCDGEAIGCRCEKTRRNTRTCLVFELKRRCQSRQTVDERSAGQGSGLEVRASRGYIDPDNKGVRIILEKRSTNGQLLPAPRKTADLGEQVTRGCLGRCAWQGRWSSP